MARLIERLRRERDRGTGAALLSVGLLAVLGALATTSSATAQTGDTLRVEVSVWRHAEQGRQILVGAGPADGSWPAPEMIPLPLDDGLSSSGRYRYGDIAIDVEWRIGAAPVTVQVRIWQHVLNEQDIHISARVSLGSWRTLGTVPLPLAAGAGSSGYRAGGITLEAPLPAGETGAPLRYRFDPTGTAAEPGSYAFLTAAVAREITTYEGLREDAATLRIEVDEDGELTYTFWTAPRASVITSYEGLRRDAVTLRVNASAVGGAPSDGLFGAVEAGHLIEWFHARDCFVRYRVTAVAEADAEAPSREFGVRPETYVFQGCQTGSLPTDGTTAAFSAAPEMPLEHLGGTNLSSLSVVHGPWQYAPSAPREPGKLTQPRPGVAALPQVRPEDANEVRLRQRELRTTDLAVARGLPYWREPAAGALPTDWTFELALGGESNGYNYMGYGAAWNNAGGYPALEIEGIYYPAGTRAGAKVSSWTTSAGLMVREPRVIAGRPAWVQYSPPGPNQVSVFPTRVWVYDAATETAYFVWGNDSSLHVDAPGAVERLVRIACSLFVSTSECTTP